jgi:hypothetical protein
MFEFLTLIRIESAPTQVYGTVKLLRLATFAVLAEVTLVNSDASNKLF